MYGFTVDFAFLHFIFVIRRDYILMNGGVFVGYCRSGLAISKHYAPDICAGTEALCLGHRENLYR